MSILRTVLWRGLIKPRVWFAKMVLFILLVSFFALGFLGYLTPIKAFLDADVFSFKVGEARFSVYLIAKYTLTTIVVFWVARVFSDFWVKRIRNMKKMRSSNKSLVVKVIQIAVYCIAFLIALDIMGIDLTALAIFGGAVGIGIGFGLQKITSNFISGLILLFEKSVEEDDLIELSDGIFGIIKHLGARYTLVETFEGKELMIPNEDFITSRVTNWTYSNAKGRAEVTLGVSYDSDIEKARELMLEAAREHPRCSADPEPECYLRSYRDSSVDFLLFFWVDDVVLGRYEPQSDVMFSIWRKFKEHDIKIPYPQRDVFIKNYEVPR
jgi:small-conductance mechanosensitive channel